MSDPIKLVKFLRKHQILRSGNIIYFKPRPNIIINLSKISHIGKTKDSIYFDDSYFVFGDDTDLIFDTLSDTMNEKV